MSQTAHKADASYLAFDLGAESGRAMLGSYDGERLALSETRRFPTGPVCVGEHLHWDILRFWSEILAGLAETSQGTGSSLASLGFDTWGVDFGLLDRQDSLVGNPYHYRDSRTNGMMEQAFLRVPRAQIYAQTGIQFMQLNSLYQLLSMRGNPALACAHTFLNIPDLFNFWLCGRKASEFTIATTTQCFNTQEHRWADELLQALEIPTHIFQPIVRPGTILERVRPSIMQDTGCQAIPVVAVGCHDTASAVAAVPAEEADFIYLSSGTWSLMGIELPQPLISPASLAYDFTNEGGLNNTYRFLKNIMGMWLLQECRREWARAGRAYTWDELTALALMVEQAADQPLIFPGDACFLAPGSMPERIQAYCQAAGQRVPQTHAEIVRCVLISLALEYRRVAAHLQELAGRPLPVIHVIGGGSRNRLLNQFTADATGRRVVAGPVEATAIGNLLAQMLALGHIGSLAEGRAIVRRSCDVAVFEPGSSEPWDEIYPRYLMLIKEV